MKRNLSPGVTKDYTPLVREALEDPRCGTLRFEPGRYDFHATRACERYLFPSNNDDGLRRVVFPIEGREDFSVDAAGANFVFHGGLVPFVLDRCRRIRLEGFSVDWEVPFHGEAEVLACRPGSIDLRIAHGFPFQVHHGRLGFGPEPGAFEIRNILEFDAGRRETAFRVFDNFGIGRRCTAVQTGPETVTIEAALREPAPQPGNLLAILSDRRDYPAIWAVDSAEIELAGLAIHHAGAMGLIAQRCEGIRLADVRVVPPDGGARMLSTTADATHFVNCRGAIEIEGCRFENQMDDATNVHGIYAEVAAVHGAADLDLRLAHRQQAGFVFAAPGDAIELADADSLEAYHAGEVCRVERLNKEYLRVRLFGPPGRQPRIGDVAANLSWAADVRIRDCICRGNRARGFLLSTPGRVLVEGNRFHTPGAAILIEGDAGVWYESGGVRDLLIRGNLFDDCLYGIWGRAVIQISPRVRTPAGSTSRYHRNIRIEENTFRVSDPRIVFARAVDGLTVRGNRIVRSDAYPSVPTAAPAFDIQDCLNVRIDAPDPAPEQPRETCAAAS